MRLTLVRNATVILELDGRRILVDPMLDDAGARPPVADTANPVPNPTVPLPFPAEEVVRSVDAVLVTHRHRDHLDGRAEALLPRDVPVFCQLGGPVQLVAVDPLPQRRQRLPFRRRVVAIERRGQRGRGERSDHIVDGFLPSDPSLERRDVERHCQPLAEQIEICS